MLQRKQTLWQLLALACAVLTLKFSFFSGLQPSATAGQPPVPRYLTAAGNIFLLILTVALIVTTLINTFNYKNRQLQLRLTILLVIVSLGNICLFYLETLKFVQGTYSLSAVLALAIPVLLILAARGIYRDQKLIKSADRLR